MDGGVEGKLGDHLVPMHYSLHLSPCLTTFTFTGQVTIDLELRQPTNCLLVNAKQLKVETVTLIREEVEVEEEKESRSKVPSPAIEDDEGGGTDNKDGGEENNDENVDDGGSKEEQDSEGPNETKTNSKLRVSHLEKEWDDDNDDDDDDGSNQEDHKEISAVSNEEIDEGNEEKGRYSEDSESDDSKSGGSFQRGGSINSGGNEDLVDCSDDSSDSATRGAVKRKSANDSTDGLSDLKYHKADDDDGDDDENHWSSRAQHKWTGWKDDEVYAVPDDDEDEVTQVDGADQIGDGCQDIIFSDKSEDIVQVDGTDSLCEEGEEPWNLVKTAKKAVEVLSFEVMEEEEVLAVNLSTSLQPGHLTLTVTYSGTLDDSMRGFYRTQHSEGWGAACHFEATGARKCFPCIDQPEFRTTFDISVTRPSPSLTVLSNMPAMGEDSAGVVTFARTPEMPTYLVCVIVGHYSSLSHRTQDGVPVSVFTPCGRTR